MTDQYPNESTPLIRDNSSGHFKINPADPSNFQDENITFYDRPTTPIAAFRQPNGHYLPARTNSRSDESSLATLAVDKKMSDPRRTFCLFVTFDFILTVLLWLIEIGTSSPDKGFFTLLDQQVTEFSLHTSLFDVVILAFLRFLFLVGSYALFRVKHWWPVAISTALSDAALIVKIFAIFPGFGAHDSGTSPLNVPMTCVLILVDFILTWIEVWFIDFKVLPAETKLAQKTAQAFVHQSLYQSPSVDMFIRRPQGNGSVFGGLGGFYSPIATPAPSEGGFTGVESMYYSMHNANRFLPPRFTPAQSKLIDQGIDGMEKLWTMYNNDKIWNVEKTLNNGDVVYSTESEYGKSYKITSTISGRSPDVVVREIVLKPEEMPSWNDTVSDVKILQRIGEQTCITLEVSAPAAMGLISSREFITVRRFEKRDDVYVSAGISTDDCEDLVPKSSFVRGFNGPTGFMVKACDDDLNSSIFTWILNTDLKGNLSRRLVNSNLTRTMTDFVKAMKSQLQVDS